MRVWLLFVECVLWFIFHLCTILVKAPLRRCVTHIQCAEYTRHRLLILGAGIVSDDERRDRA